MLADIWPDPEWLIISFFAGVLFATFIRPWKPKDRREDQGH